MMLNDSRRKAMRIARIIKTKYYGPTDHHGARIRAWVMNEPRFRYIMLGYDHAKSFEENCRDAVKMLLAKNNAEWIIDETPIKAGMKGGILWFAVEEK
jgi:hypothetical protein